MEDKVDFVLIWVDGSDPNWVKEKAKYSDNPESIYSDVNRYRDWELLKYWFRGVEKYTPWVNHVYFITCGHYPEWLNLENPKLKFLKHDEYIPKEYLPTFSSHPIELNLHRVKELSEKFVYFNDDTFIIKEMNQDDFFKNNKPRYIACNDIIYSDKYDDSFPKILLNDIAIINKYFDKKKVMKQNLKKWFSINYDKKILMKNLCMMPFNKFSTIHNEHLASPLLKSTMYELWEKEKNILEITSSHRFRSKEDVNQYLFKWYDIARGNFEPGKKIGEYFPILSNYNNLLLSIEKQKCKMVCLSDEMEVDFKKAKEEIKKSFEKILPDKCSFER